MTYPYVAGAVLLASDLNTDFAAKRDNAPAINAQTGTTYTFVLTDATAGKTITASNAAASTYTVPPQSSVAFSAGALLQVTNLGAGVVTFAGGSGVTVTNTAGTLAQYQSATLVRTGSDAWTVIPAGGSKGLKLIAIGTASAASSLSINNCFSADYKNYLVMRDFLGSVGAQDINVRLRVGGVDESGSNYRLQTMTASGTSVTSARATAQTSWTRALGYTEATAFGFARLFISKPFDAVKTTAWSDHSYDAGGNITLNSVVYAHDLTTSYTGITATPVSGTLTGTITVFGLQES